MKKILDVLAFLFVLANVVISLVFYFTTDEIAIPAHPTTYSEMSSYGQTWMILLLAGLSVLIYALILTSEKYHVVNLPFKMKHQAEALPFVDKMLAWTNMLVMLILLYSDVAVAQYIPFNILVVIAIILLICIVGFYYTRKIYKCGRK